MVSKTTILSFKIFLKKAWAWAKAHWKITLAVVSLCVITFVSKSKSRDLMKVIKHLRDAYEKESRELDEIHTNEIESIKRSHERMNEALHEVEKRYAEAEKDLDEKTRKEILKTLKKNSDNPDHITQRISEITGFDIYVD